MVLVFIDVLCLCAVFVCLCFNICVFLCIYRAPFKNSIYEC